MMKKFQKSLIYIATLLSIPFILWNICWGLIGGFILLIILTGGCLLYYNKNSLKHFVICFLVGIVVYLGMLPFTLYQYQLTSSKYTEKVERGMNLNFIEKLNVYGLNIIISLGAYPFYPEIAKESLLMIFPTKNNERIFYSGFFMKSEKIRKGFQNNKNYITWKGADYLRFDAESRCALALNPCKLQKVKKENSIVYSVKVNVTYPYKCHTEVLPGVYIDEGLFHYLQSIGWLYPYTATWKCTKHQK